MLLRDEQKIKVQLLEQDSTIQSSRGCVPCPHTDTTEDALRALDPRAEKLAGPNCQGVKRPEYRRA